jgi:hypothetical protein
MRKCLIVISVMALCLLVAPISVAEPATTTIELLNPPKKGLLELAVGESYTFDIEITSAEPFVQAIALGDQYYPGRGIFYNGNDIAQHATSALLHLTMTGKEPTDFLPDGVAPAAVVAGVRYGGQDVISERFDFVVRVVEP